MFTYERGPYSKLALLLQLVQVLYLCAALEPVGKVAWQRHRGLVMKTAKIEFRFYRNAS